MHNQIGEGGLSALASMLRANHRIKLLNLMHTDVTSKGGQLLLDAVIGHPGLHHLELHDTKVASKDRAAIEAKLEENRKAHAAEEARDAAAREEALQSDL